jgi:hypothetical protein
VTALLLVAALATGAPASYADANQAYKEGRWAEAAAGYEELLSAGIVHPDLHYNLGNAYFRDGRLGRAIYHYQRSLALAPGRDDAAHNLGLARQLAEARWSDKVEGAGRAPLWARVATAFSLRGLAWTFLFADLALFACLIARRRVQAPGGRRALGWGAVLGGAAVAVSGLLLAAHIWRVDGRDAGVVLDDEVGVRESADDHSVARVVIHGGLEVEITGRETGWMRIELPNRVEGWVPSTAIGEL